MSAPSVPAVLGGQPVRTKPYPPPNFIGPQERELVNRVLDSGVLSAYVAHEGPWFNGGPMVHDLEKEFCRTFGSKFAVSVNSATSGLHASVAAALAGAGDEVIVSPYTMSATATMIAATNATPVFADIDPSTYCLDLSDVRKKISGRTKAILVVNIFGGPADLIALRELADQHGIYLIEDNSQSPGARVGQRFAGTIGHMGVFSLNCHKTIQCGEGGVVLTDDPVLADRLRLVRNHGEVVQSQRETVPDELLGLVGFNFRLTELQSAVALAQIRRLEELTAGRIMMAETITRELRGIDGLHTPFVASGNRHVYYVYPIRIEADRFGLSRHQLKVALDREGLVVSEGYVRPIYLYPMYDRRVAAQRRGFGAGLWYPREDSGVSYDRGICPVTERMHFVELMSTPICRADLGEAEAKEFATAIARVYEHRRAVREALVREGVV